MTEQERLHIVLLALLPTDGSLITGMTLASLAGITRSDVYPLLRDDVKAGRVEYQADSYRSVKQGDAL